MDKSKNSILALSLIFVSILSLNSLASLTSNITKDPKKAEFIWKDVNTFIKVMEKLDLSQSDEILEEILERKYFELGTPGLKIFVKKYNLNPKRLLKAIRKRPEKYKSLNKTLRLIKKNVIKWRNAYIRLKDFIPQAVFPPTYFLVGAYRGIGSGSTEGPLLTVEKWAPPLQKTPTIVHEMTHLQQVHAQGYQTYIKLFNEGKSLLGLCIREGTAVFFAHQITGKIGESKAKALRFLRKHEKRMWYEFKKEMMNRDPGEWLWQNPKDPEQPRDVGYALGYLIIEAYYNNAPDKEKALRDILSVSKDYPDFLKRSGYPEKFNKH